MNKLDKDYQSLLKDILKNGNEKDTRNGKVLSVFGRTIHHSFKNGKFPLLTTKKMYTKGIITELLWFLRAETNIKFLLDNNCNIWNGDCYSNYSKNILNTNDGSFLLSEPNNTKPSSLSFEKFVEKLKTDDEFCKIWGSLGPVYGVQWRKWKVTTNDEQPPNYENTETYIDQIANLIHDLKNNPDSRRLLVTAWNPTDLDKQVLPPCHFCFQCYTRELSHDERFELYKLSCGRDLQPHISGFNFKEFHFDEYNIPKRALSLKWTQRSVDVLLGLPFNIASYGLLLEILAKECNMVADELIGELGDTHLYLNHIEQAKEQISREPYELPKLEIKLHFEQEDSFKPEWWLPSDFEIMNYKYHPAIKADLSN